MADFSTLKTQLLSIIQELSEWDSDNSVSYPIKIEDMNEDPFLVVIASENRNEFATTSENRRTYQFTITIFVGIGSRNEQTAESVLTTLVDNIIDQIDNNTTLNDNALFTQAVPSSWGFVDEPKRFRVAEIEVRSKTDFSVTP